MLFTLIMPVVMVFVLWGGRKGFLGHQSEFFFPAGAAYCMLVMTNIVYNSFGGDGGGVQFFLFSPIAFRKIVVGKNLAQCAVLAAEIIILWIGVTIIYRPPEIRFLALTFAWYLVAAPINFTAGNLLSIYFPKRIDYSTFGRQRASESTILISLAVQMTAAGLGALAIFIGYRSHDLWTATLILLALSVPAVSGYFVMLHRIDNIALRRREVLASELCRT